MYPSINLYREKIIMQDIYLKFFVWFGMTFLHFNYIDIYSPGFETGDENEKVVAVTFSISEEYINKIHNIE